MGSNPLGATNFMFNYFRKRRDKKNKEILDSIHAEWELMTWRVEFSDSEKYFLQYYHDSRQDITELTINEASKLLSDKGFRLQFCGEWDYATQNKPTQRARMIGEK